MHLDKKSIQDLDKIERLNLINSVTGVKPANLIGSHSEDGHSNLAIFSSVIHLGSNPALIGFNVRPSDEVRRDTYENIMATGFYTINHVHNSFIQQAHYTSAKFDREESEFEKCGLTAEWMEGFPAPYVKESRLKLGMRFVRAIPIDLNDTALIIGTVEHIYLPDEAFEKGGHLNLEALGDTGISGLNSYYSLKKMDQFPYARPHELPDFNK
ncbi:MAG: flavin reductase family protein [Bacteroidetes bacterium]|nr:flavin reductase family protein [Bacteroidota bacterium]